MCSLHFPASWPDHTTHGYKLTYTFRATDYRPPMLRHLRRQRTNHGLIVCAVALNNAQGKDSDPFFPEKPGTFREAI
jgi:hypothetical protein